MMGSSNLHHEIETSALVSRGIQRLGYKRSIDVKCALSLDTLKTFVGRFMENQSTNWKPKYPLETNNEDKSSLKPTLYNNEQMEFL